MRYLSFILLFFVFAGCGKKVSKVDSNYIDTWTGFSGSKNYTITIKSDNSAVYSESEGLMTGTEVKGTARISGSNLKIGFKKFSIDEEPTYVNASSAPYWKMTIDGIQYMHS